MGLDLTLYPKRHPRIADLHAVNRLDFEQDSEMFERISVLEAHLWPREDEFSYLSEDGLETTDEDAYGTRLTFVYASDLATVEASDGFAWNAAVLAFVRALPPDTRIVLYWN